MMSAARAGHAPSVLTRRERQRQATHDEIVAVARRLLRSSDQLSLRAIATEMGMTAPALYRYVDSHASLLDLLADVVLDDVVASMRRAADGYPVEDPGARIVAASLAFRRWALANVAEFQLVFASPARDEDGALATPETAHVSQRSMAFGEYFAGLFLQVWSRQPFAVPDDAELHPSVVEAIVALAAASHGDPHKEALLGGPLGLLWVFQQSWARLYGVLALEVFGHVTCEFIRTGALFRAMLQDCGRAMGLEPEWERLARIVDTELAG